MSERWSFLIRKTILSSMFEIIYSHTSIVPQFYCRKIGFSKGRISSCWHRSMDKLTNAKRCIHLLLTIRTAHSFTFFIDGRMETDLSVNESYEIRSWQYLYIHNDRQTTFLCLHSLSDKKKWMLKYCFCIYHYMMNCIWQFQSDE